MIKKTIERVKSFLGIKRYKIQEVIKPGQVILVQVIKEERGQKGAALINIYFFGWKIYCLNAEYSKRWKEFYLKKNL